MIQINPTTNRLEVQTKLYYLATSTIADCRIERYTGPDIAVISVEWTYANARALAALGCPAASTMMRDYKYPKLHGKFDPMPHQYEIAEFLSINERAFCFAGMGTGKTASALWAADYLISIGEVKRVLVVCTKSTMRPAWVDTVFGLMPQHTCTMLRGDRTGRLRKANDNARFHIINHDGVSTIKRQLLANDYDLIIVDESTAFKNADTKRWGELNAIVSKAKRAWLMTGSPTPKSPEDAYGQAKMIVPERVPKYFTAWKNMVMQQASMYRWTPKPSARDDVFQAMQPAIYIKKEDVLKNQPETFKVYREVETTPEQKRLLKALKAQEVMYSSEGNSITPVHAASALTKYMQILLGAVYTDEGTADIVDCEPRIKEVIELIEEGKAQGVGDWNTPLGKSIVAVPYRHVLEVYQKALTEAGYKVGVIHGGVNVSKRDQIVHLFQTTSEIDVMLVVPQSIAHGLTLTAANTFIWCCPLVPPEVFQQANERMDRPGQVQTMTQARLYSTDEERRYYTVLEDRERWQNNLLGMYNTMLQSI